MLRNSRKWTQTVTDFCEQYEGTLTRNNRTWYQKTNGQWEKIENIEPLCWQFLRDRDGFQKHRDIAAFRFEVAQNLKYSEVGL